MRLWGNDYNRMELAGAFGDLGTLIPFVLGYLTLNKLDPLGILVTFGIFNIFVGLYYKTPIPTQPMKAIGGMAIAHASVTTPGMIWGSGIFTGVFWLLMGLSGAVTWIEKITTKPVVRGIMLGLGLSFMIEGLGMMKLQPLAGLGGVLLILILLGSRRLPGMLVLLCYGVILAVAQKPSLLFELSHISVSFRLPQPVFSHMSWSELLAGFVILGLPQAPLTLGNAIIGTVEENNRHFPDKKVTAKGMSIDQGVMNLVSASIGGIPLCHGAGGMAGHIRFGARTGGSMVMLGTILLVVGFLFSDSVSLLLQVFPRAVLGVILFFAGLELSLVIRDIRLEKQNLFVLLATAGTAMWNMGIAYLAGLALFYALKRKWIRI
ncbi:MAG: hypothetical protein A4E57_01720 [Syntrophorhabdaceae bacterium PtaU1.Bin034]|jgi:MFS superfamily sulfate permease-like transporter|nr:MAG: hypothetical protein A4E57_01720 [Syntrophorhabdaceae bacterium PtaU1.Bin034]